MWVRIDLSRLFLTKTILAMTYKHIPLYIVQIYESYYLLICYLSSCVKLICFLLTFLFLLIFFRLRLFVQIVLYIVELAPWFTS